MLLIIIILLVAFVIIPLIELTLKERLLYAGKLLVYLAAFLYIIWVLYHTRVW